MKNTSKKLLFIGILALCSAMPYHRVHSMEAYEAFGEEEGTDCTICYDTLDKDSLIIQLDCDQKVTHSFHLRCIKDWAVKYKNTTCPICRKNIKVHDPRTSKNSYARVHHRQKPLTAGQQAQLRAFLTNNAIKNRLSKKKMADTIVRNCCAPKHSQGCDKEVPGEDIYIQFGCSHGACLDGALALARRTKNECPTCHAAIQIIDPIKRDKGQTVLAYGQHKLTQQELQKIQEIRTFAHVSVKQNHIPQNQRVTLKKGAATWKAPKKNGRKQFPQGIIDGLTPEEYALNMQFGLRKNNTLPISKEKFPLKGVSKEDIRLNNEHLPENINPCKWQVIMQKDGTLARAKRIYPLKKWPAEEADGFNPKENHPLKGKQGDLAAGFLFGYLIGPEFRTRTAAEEQYLPLRRLTYIPALYGGYSILKEANPERTMIKPKHALRWVTGIALGAYVNYLQSKN